MHFDSLETTSFTLSGDYWAKINDDTVKVGYYGISQRWHVVFKEGCYVIGDNTDPKELSAQEVIEAYKKQHTVERGFHFLKAPLFFVPSLS